MPAGQRTRRGVLALGLSAVLAGCAALFGPEFPEDSEQPPDAHIEVVGTFIEQVHAGEYEAAREPFTDELRDALSASEIEDTWDDETSHLGGYEDVAQWAYEPDEPDDDDLEIVYARVGMTEGHYDLRVTLDGDRQLGGVFIIDVVED